MLNFGSLLDNSKQITTKIIISIFCDREFFYTIKSITESIHQPIQMVLRLSNCYFNIENYNTYKICSRS